MLSFLVQGMDFKVTGSCLRLLKIFTWFLVKRGMIQKENNLKA